MGEWKEIYRVPTYNTGLTGDMAVTVSAEDILASQKSMYEEGYPEDANESHGGVGV